VYMHITNKLDFNIDNNSFIWLEDYKSEHAMLPVYSDDQLCLAGDSKEQSFGDFGSYFLYIGQYST